MLATLLLSLAPTPLALQDPPPPPPPDAEVVAATVDALKKAYAGKELEPKTAAVANAREVLDKKVIETLARGIREPEPEVKTAVLEALRWMDHPVALEELHDIYKRESALEKDEALYPMLLKAIGQHASPDSIEVLVDNPFKVKGAQALEARVLGLGRIRSEDSVKELIGMLQLVGKGKTVGRMQDFRLALMALTGVDKGTSRDAWIAWWNDNKKTLELPKEMPQLPEKLQRRWDYYWGEEHVQSRGKKREDRGGDE